MTFWDHDDESGRERESQNTAVPINAVASRAIYVSSYQDDEFSEAKSGSPTHF